MAKHKSNRETLHQRLSKTCKKGQRCCDTCLKVKNETEFHRNDKTELKSCNECAASAKVKREKKRGIVEIDGEKYRKCNKCESLKILTSFLSVKLQYVYCADCRTAVKQDKKQDLTPVDSFPNYPGYSELRTPEGLFGNSIQFYPFSHVQETLMKDVMRVPQEVLGGSL